MTIPHAPAPGRAACYLQVFLFYLISSPYIIPCYYTVSRTSAHPPKLLVEIRMYSSMTIVSLFLQLTLQAVANQNQFQHTAHATTSWENILNLLPFSTKKNKQGHYNFLDIIFAAVHQHIPNSFTRSNS